MKVLTVGKNDEGQRLDRFVAKAVPLLPDSLLHKYIRLKRIKLNGKAAKPSTNVKIGDVIEVLYSAGSLKVRVLNIKETVKKDEAASLYEVIV